jgi:hypothetical protein
MYILCCSAGFFDDLISVKYRSSAFRLGQPYGTGCSIYFGRNIKSISGFSQFDMSNVRDDKIPFLV